MQPHLNIIPTNPEQQIFNTRRRRRRKKTDRNDKLNGTELWASKLEEKKPSELWPLNVRWAFWGREECAGPPPRIKNVN